MTYFQNFNGMPVNGGGSADAANPNSVQTETNFTVQDLTTGGPLNLYALANPFDFAYPIISSGTVGGLGVSSMAGWYAYCSANMEFGATYGDQSAGGVIDNGQNFYGVTVTTDLTGVTNRSLGMISTTKSGYVAYGVALINKTGNTISNINMSFIAEIWRNNPNQQPVAFSYAVDLAGTNSLFSPGTPIISGDLQLTTVPGLGFSFPTSTNTVINNGALPANQLNLATNAMAVPGWSNNAALWLVWESQNPQGGAQALAIDNLSVSATVPLVPILPINIKPGSIRFIPAGGGGGSTPSASFSFTNVSGLSLSVLGTNNISAPRTDWPVLGQAVESPAGSGSYQFTNSAATNATMFYILRQP